MAKAKQTTQEAPMELTYESLIAMGCSPEEANILLSGSQNQGGGLPFPSLKVVYDFDSEIAPFGSFVTNMVKEDGEITSADVVTSGVKEKLNMVVLASKFQYSKYDSVAGSTVVSSNVFSSLAEAKSAVDTKSGIAISTLKKNDDKIKLQEIALVRVWGDNTEPTTAIFYIKGAMLYTFNQVRSGLPNGGNVLFSFSLQPVKLKNGSVVYVSFDVDESTATQRTMEDVKNSMADTAASVKKFTEWADSLNAGGTGKSAKKQDTPVADDDEDDDLDFE